jgi:glutamine synthetase
LEGIKKKIKPPHPCDRNIYEMTAADRQELGIGTLPASLEEALNELVKDSVIMEALGSHVGERFVEAKRIEWDRYRVQVHQWETEEYLSKF